jgi:hypothetical protein
LESVPAKHSPSRSWQDSPHCAYRAHCKTCRSRGADGVEFRAKLTRLGFDDPPDFDCKHGIPWEAEQQWPTWAKLVAAMKAPEDKGVGSTIDRKLGLLGAAFKLTLKALGVPCGCGDRRDLYDKLYPYP